MVIRTFHTCALLALSILASACSDGVSPGDQLPHRNNDYLWPENAVHRYLVMRGDDMFRHALSPDGSGGFVDVLEDAQARILARNNWSASRSSGLLTGAGPNTLWHLPPEFRLVEQVFSAPGPVVRGNCILPLDETNMLVGTAEDGLFHYSISRGEWYTIELPVAGPVTALCRDSTNGNMTLYVAMGSAGIYRKARYDSAWTKLPALAAAANDIESSRSGTLFAVIGSQLWFLLPSQETWTSFSIFPGTSDVKDIAILPLSQEDEILLVATRGFGVAYIQLINSLPITVGYSERAGFEDVRGITTCPDAPYIAVGISDPPMLCVSPQVGLWIPISIDVPATLTCVVQSASRGTVLVGSTAGIYRYTGLQQPLPSALQGERIRTLRACMDGAFYAGTDNGFYRSKDDGMTWTRIDGGTVLMRRPMPWLLLPQRFDVGSAWTAVELTDGTGRRIALTGRVLHRFDELILPDEQGRYRDAIAVRYAEETAGGEPRTAGQTWTAYFVRGKGLVYLEEADGTGITSQVFLENH